jgi:hypothetical protein
MLPYKYFSRKKIEVKENLGDWRVYGGIILKKV